MLFWILLTITVLIVVGTVLADDWTPFASGFLALVVCSVVGFLALMVCWGTIGANHDLVRTTTYQLRALGTSTGIEGRSYFLGGGYIKDKRVLNYITDESGAIRVQQSDAGASTIYENSTAPTVIVRHYDHNNGWLVPWPGGSDDTYEFRIPAGSVMSDYTVNNK
jgi:hypothetical protein